MHRPRNTLIPGLFFFFLFLSSLNAQDLNWDDSLHTLILKTPRRGFRSHLKYKSELDYSVNIAGDYFVNYLKNDNASQISFNHSLKYKISLSGNSFIHFTGNLAHNLGIQCYFDSICKVGTDENTLTSELALDVNRFLQFSVISVLNTRIFNDWEIVPLANGGISRTLNASFLTPLICTFSGGLGLKIPEFGSLDLGVASAKLTYLHDRSVFDRTGLLSFYGVPKGKHSLFEYGLNMQLIINRLIGKHMQWNCDLLLFKKNDSPVDVSLKNLFAYRISRYFKTSLQTQLFYDEKVSRQVRLENLLSLGFDFHL